MADDERLAKSYVGELQRNVRAGNATEPSHYPGLKTFLQALAGGLTATVNPKRIECGAPDFVVSRRTGNDLLTIGYVEAKDVGVSLDEAEHSDQLKRYLTLPNLILTDYVEFRWYVDGERRPTARLGEWGKAGKLSIAKDGVQNVIGLLRAFLEHAPEPVANPKELAVRMARLTHFIRDMVVEAFNKDQESGTLRDLHKAFEETLIPDLSVPQFADMFAQTLAYGLFAARVNHDESRGRFRRVGAAAEIPKTNPFVRRLFGTITGPDLEDEPFAGFVDDLEQLLADTEISAVLADFGKRKRKEDPIVHFYETFLGAYDPKLRKVRGVYFTPEPVVSYIVRSVDHLLKSRFNCPGGLADTGTATYTRTDENGQTDEETAPRVLILDPVCGTGTFLYAVVDQIRDSFIEQDNAGLWSGYVGKHLLPRLFGFELLMAPYAVAHLKMGMQLAAQDMSEAERAEWAYDFSGNQRLGVYLTNTLEEARRKSELLFGAWIADEANAAAEIKRDLPVMVVLGNPPYAGHSANRSFQERPVKAGERYLVRAPRDPRRWVEKTARRDLRAKEPTFIGRLLEDYYEVDGEALHEKNPKWLQDDYVKFIRFGQWRIERTGAGVLCFVTNHGYLDNPTFRGMRQQLMNSFTDIYILDLHGNKRKKESAPDGGPDNNVFDIQQGVAIGVFVKEPGRTGPAKVHHADLWGRQEAKYSWLFGHDVTDSGWKEVQPEPPFYLFTPLDTDLRAEYERGWRVPDAMPVNVLGFQTHRDHFAIAFDEERLRVRIGDLHRKARSDGDLRKTYALRDNRDWQLPRARRQLRDDDEWQTRFLRCLYRPFDWRWCYFGTAAMDYPRRELIQHVAGRDNCCLLVPRQIGGVRWQHAAVATDVAESCAVSSQTKEQNYVFPLYLCPSEQEVASKLYSADERRPNLAPGFIEEFVTRLNLGFVPHGAGDLDQTFGPEDVFHYMYAIFHSPAYRERYAQFLKMDYPRVPITGNLDLFRALAAKGAELVVLHLMDLPSLADTMTHYPIPGPNIVEASHPRYVAPGEPEPGKGEPLESGRVYISKDDLKRGKRGQYFEGVPPDIWNFHVGGYQVCEKWLKDRRGRVLSHDDLTHYAKIVVALRETIRLMGEIDAAVPAWPIE